MEEHVGPRSFHAYEFPPFTASSLSTLADALLAGLFLIIYLHPVSHASARVIPYTRTS